MAGRTRVGCADLKTMSIVSRLEEAGKDFGRAAIKVRDLLAQCDFR